MGKSDNGTSGVQSQHKDTLFRLIFQEKKDLLELYNAIRGTDYRNPDELEVTTLDNMLFMGVKNDLSFLIDHVLNLYEHQSTWNANMPLRGLEYFAELYKKYVKQMEGNIYGRKQILLPYPQYIVFYNGTKEEPERQELRLSEAYIKPEDMVSEDEEACLECVATVLNINAGKNRMLMEKCKKLEEYAQFVECVRRTAGNHSVTKKVMEAAIEECIQNGILTEILEKYRWEVSEMFQDFNMEEYVDNQRRDAYEDGVQDGERKGEIRGRNIITELMRKLFQDGRNDDVKKISEDEGYQTILLREYGLVK